MARPCSVCTHAERAAIDVLAVNGSSSPKIAAKYRVSVDAVDRHRGKHIPRRLAQSHQAEQVVQADDLVSQVKALRNKSLSILLAAEKSNDLKTALSGIRTALACLELLAEMERAVDRRPTINILAAPQWLAVRAAMLEALRPYPDARVAVADRLATLEALA